MEYLVKNYDNLITALISDQTLLKLGLHILSMEYLEDGASYFTKVTKYDNIGFNHKAVEDEDGEEDSKEAVTNLDEEASKKRVQHKAKRDTAQTQVLLLAAVLGLFALLSVSVPVL